MSQQFCLRFLSRIFCACITAAVLFFPAPLQAIPAPVSVLLQINRLAGSSAGTGGFSGDAGPALLSMLQQPESVAVDGAGNLYIADTGNNRIRRIDAATGVITTVAGNGQQGYNGDGPAASVELNQPGGVAIDAHGNLYIADTGNNIIRSLNITTGVLTTVVGTPNITVYSPSLGDGGPANQAQLQAPAALAFDAAGDLYIADAGDNRIREVVAASGNIATVAGNGTPAYGGDNGSATLAELNNPTGIALDASSNLYIADSSNNLIREVNALTGVITTVAGVAASPGGYNGDNMLATLATLNFPTGIASDEAGEIYFSDRDNQRIRKIIVGGNIQTLAGNGTAGDIGDGNLASNAEVSAPGGVALDAAGNLYLADSGNNALRMVSMGLNFPAAEIATSTPVTHTIFLGLNQSVTLSTPTIAPAELEPQQGSQPPVQPQEYAVGSIGGCTADGVTANPSGSTCTVPVTFVPGYPGTRTGAMEFTANNNISMSLGLYGIGLGPQAVVVPGIIQTVLYSTDAFNGMPLTAPQQVVVDPAGNLYVADPTSNVIWSLQNLTGASPTIVAGGGALAPAQADGGQAVDAALNQPSSVALDAAGNLYIAETGANLVRKVNLATGIITTVAGNGTAGDTGDDGAAISAELNHPAGIAANAAGDLFIADTGNNVVRRVYALTGTIVTISGNGTPGYSGDLGAALLAELQSPQSVAVDTAGTLYIADTGNNVIRSVNPVTGSIATIAGNGTLGFSGDGAAAVNANLSHPAAVAVDAAGNVYVADTGNARVRKIYAQSGTIVTLAGSALVGYAGDGKAANAAALSTPSGVAVDSLGQVLISDPGNDTVRRVSIDTPTLDFGSEAVGGATPAQTDFLSNIGNQPLAISQFLAPPVPVDFLQGSDAAQCSVGNLVAGNLCDLSFVFQPTVTGPLTEDALIADNSLNATGAEQMVPMTGNGTADTSIVTMTVVTVAPVTAIYGTPIQLTANVTSNPSSVINGDVEFSINGIEVAGAVLTGSGTATVTVPAAPTGTDIVTATFAAQGNYQASSGTASLTVAPAGSQVTLSASASQIRQGQNVIFTANATSTTTGTPTGTVVFLNGSAQIGEATLNATGQAILNTQNLPPGTDTITAQYQGDVNFQPSTSNAVTVTVADDTLTMVANPTQLSISTGSTGQTTLTLTPKNGFAGTVYLSCANLIHGATCQFSSPSLVFVAQTQTPQTVTLIIDPNTVVTSGFTLPAKGRPILQFFLILLGLGATLLPFFSRRRYASLRWGRVLLVVLCLGLSTLSGCANLAVATPVSDGITVQASMPSSGVITTAQLQVYMAQ